MLNLFGQNYVIVSPMPVRNATTKDCFRIAEIGAASWRVTFKGLVPDDMLDNLDVEGSAQRWADCIERLPQNVKVFEHNQQILGWICAGPVSEKSKLKQFDGKIYGIHTDPIVPRIGAGSALLQAACESLKAQNCLEIYVLVLKQNENAIRFYQKHGAVLQGEYSVNFGGRDLPELAFQWSL